MDTPLFLKPKNIQEKEDKSLVIPALDEYIHECIISKDLFIIYNDWNFEMSKDINEAYLPLQTPRITLPGKGVVTNVYCVEWF